MAAMNHNMSPVDKLRASHPCFRDVTNENFSDYFALLVPQVIVELSKRDSSVMVDPIMPFLAGDMGAILLENFVDMPEDRLKFGSICHYIGDQALITRHPDIHQVVIFDMVMETRSFRMPELADCRVFELVVNNVIMQEKERGITASGAPLLAKARFPLCVDHRKDGWEHKLLNAGFNPDEPTCWVMSSYLSHMSVADGSNLMSVIASLSAPNSQIYADMFCGHMPALTSEDGAITTSANLFDMNGASACVFQSLREWMVELLARRDSEGRYYGTMWDLEKLGRWMVTDSETGFLGPWFVVRFTKQQEEATLAPV